MHMDVMELDAPFLYPNAHEQGIKLYMMWSFGHAI